MKPSSPVTAAAASHSSWNSTRIMWAVAAVAVAAGAAATYYKKQDAAAHAPTPLSTPAELNFTARPKASGAFGDESPAELKDIPYTSESPIDWPAILKEHMASLAPYSIDIPNKRVVVCLTDGKAFDDSNLTFYYQAQRAHMTRAFAIPFADYCDAVEKAMNDDKDTKQSLRQTLFLHSTGRCGSTLFSRLFAELGSTHNLQEPDIFMSHTVIAQTQPDLIDPELHKRLVRSSTYMLVRNARLTHPDAANIIIKTRSHSVQIAQLIADAVPESQKMFLYRNAIDTVDSFCAAFFNSRIARISRYLHLDSVFLFKLTNIAESLPVIAPLLSNPRYSYDLVYRLGAPGITAIGWLSCMDRALQLQKNKFFDAVVRYEDLITHRMDIVRKVGDLCGLKDIEEKSEKSDQKAEAVFDEDAHAANARTASLRRQQQSDEPIFVRPEDAKDVAELIAEHDEIKEGGFIIPGTVSC
eukprot:m.131599 g.131599  ORF g.131599 m.131599 type:complete len:469 (+) comp16465_c0_seq1:103-1509(+)